MIHVWIGAGAEFGKCRGVLAGKHRCKLVIQQCCLPGCRSPSSVISHRSIVVLTCSRNLGQGCPSGRGGTPSCIHYVVPFVIS